MLMVLVGGAGVVLFGGYLRWAWNERKPFLAIIFFLLLLLMLGIAGFFVSRM
ncbi:hypothetical protein [Spongiactinospora rosea]|uniref:hypothetical protein n=1 Tax=Spongiactinospora rosea TaxID=2248750 RepID=UPI001314B380|nr:hypothetical protein [Spongiactinospora rosea]